MSTRASTASSASAWELGERGLVDRIRSRFPTQSESLTIGIGDDAAIIAPARGALLAATTDGLVEGVHFDLAYSSFADVGFKALAVNVSDVAAMGATPRFALLSLILPERMSTADIDALLDGVQEMASEAGVAVAGGNLARSPSTGSAPGPLIVDVTVFGFVKPRKVLTRSGGHPGDALYLSGTIGAASAGLDWLRAQPRSGRKEVDDPALAECVARHRRPVPRVRLGSIAGRTRAASACMDLSDGLADAVTQIARQSGTGATIEASALPIHAGASKRFSQQGGDPIMAAVTGGDDYELLFAVPPRHRGRFRSVIQQARGVPLTRIGELTRDPAVVLTRNGRPEPMPSGFVHF